MLNLNYMNNNINFVSIDLETATSERSSICEIGISVVKNGNILESKSWLVKPDGNYYDEFNIGIHGITPDMTAFSPDFPTIWKKIYPYIENQTVIAHNTSFDMYALKDAFNKYNIEYPSFYNYCSYRIAKYTIKNTIHYSLPALCNLLNINFPHHHRAEGDAIACAKIFLKCLEISGTNSIEKLQKKFEFNCGQFSSPKTFIPQKTIKKDKKRENNKIYFGDPEKIDEGSYFYGKTVCFTGKCVYGTRDFLMQKIADIGGRPVNSVTKNTDILIIGQQDYRVVGDAGISSKQEKAMKLNAKGVQIEVISEKDFLTMI